MTPTRIYIARPQAEGAKPRLIRAPNSASLVKAKAGEVYEKAAERLAEARWLPEFGRAA